MTDFKLRRPCPKCPFRTDVPPYLRGAGAEEIARSIAGGSDFPCHETTVSGAEDDNDRYRGPDSQMCAGALIVMEHEGQPNQYARIGQRLGYYDPGKLDMDAPVCRSFSDFVRHHSADEEEIEPCEVVESGCLSPAGYMEGGVVIEAAGREETHCCVDCGCYVCDNCAGLCCGTRCVECGEIRGPDSFEDGARCKLCVEAQDGVAT